MLIINDNKIAIIFILMIVSILISLYTTVFYYKTIEKQDLKIFDRRNMGILIVFLIFAILHTYYKFIAF